MLKKGAIAVFSMFFIILSSLLAAPGSAIVYPDGFLLSWEERPEVVQILGYTEIDESGGRIYRSACTGTLIKDDMVLTAAHCLDGPEIDSFIVVVSADSDKSGRVYLVNKWLIHPEFQISKMVSDLGLVFLEKPVIGIQPIKLPPLNDRNLDTLSKNVLYGWGIDQNGVTPKSVGFARVDDYTGSASLLLPGFNPELMIAAGRIKSDGSFTGACQGDSGGPLLSTFANTTFVIGVVSYGEQRCKAAAPTAFTRVSAYVDWIEDSR